MKYRIIFLNLLVIGSMILAGCAAPTAVPPPPPTKAPEPTKAPAAPPAAAPTAAAPAAALDPVKLVDTKCSVCHNTDRIKAAKKTAEQWKTSVDTMLAKDWTGKASPKPTADEAAAIIKYLAATYAAAAAPAATVAPTKVPSTVLKTGKDTVIMGMFQALEFLNVLYTTGGNSLSASKLAQRGLLFLDKDSKWVGELAAEVPSLTNGGITADGKKITYKLKKTLTFHDGSPVTSKDVKATWEAIMDPKNTPISRVGYKEIESIDLPDDYTVVMNYKNPYAAWATLFDAIMPKAVFDKNPPGTLDKSQAMRQPVSFGPYKIVEWKTGDYIKFEAFDKYWNGAPKIKNFYIKTYPSVDAVVQALEAKEIDIAWSMAFSLVPQLQKLEPKGIKIVTQSVASTERYHMNPEEPLFQDIKVRQAIQHATPKETVTKNLLYGLAQPGLSEWSGSPWENKNLVPYAFDLKKCGELMDQAGWKLGTDGIREKDGKKFTFKHNTTTGDRQRENVQLIVQQSYKQCGLNMVIENKPSTELFGTWAQNGVWAQGKFQMAGWAIGFRAPDPDVNVRLLCSEVPSEKNQSGGQWFRYCNPELDKLLLAQAKEFDIAKRTALIYQAQELIHKDAYTVHIFKGASNYAINANLKNFMLHPFANFYFNPQEWEWAP